MSSNISQWKFRLLVLFLFMCYNFQQTREMVHSHVPPDLDSSSAQQVHISLAGKSKMRVSWVTESHVPSIVFYGTSKGKYRFSAKGTFASYDYDGYTSGRIHNVVIGPLMSAATYFYQCGNKNGKEYTLRTPPATFPLKFAVVGDLGQTNWTESTLQRISKSGYDVFLLPGDLSYANGQQLLWDTFGQLVEPLASQKPWMVAVGNHEVETTPVHPERFTAYNARWHMPFRESKSPSNLYYSFNVAGAHVTVLASYAAFEKGSAQYGWLKADLKSVDRTKTPWLIVLVHAPWYNSNKKHQGESASVNMKHSMERVIRKARVDIIFAGHVHAYERFTRVWNNHSDKCGAVHITVGAGGNEEGLAVGFKDPQPKISAYREASFGHGQLLMVNETHAKWTWHRNDDAQTSAADSVWLESLASNRNSKKFNLISCFPKNPIRLN